jgi:hypothetical protein
MKKAKTRKAKAVIGSDRHQPHHDQHLVAVANTQSCTTAASAIS